MSEPGNLLYFLSPAFIILVLLGLYFVGVWLRSYVFPTNTDWPIKRQLLAGIPVGLLTMALYGKTVIPGLHFNSPDVVYDLCFIAGYTIIFGMMSREALERLMKSAPAPDLPPLPKF